MSAATYYVHSMLFPDETAARNCMWKLTHDHWVMTIRSHAQKNGTWCVFAAPFTDASFNAQRNKLKAIVEKFGGTYGCGHHPPVSAPSLPPDAA
jgi:hypothetical protein